MKKNKKILLTVATVAIVSLAACNGNADRASYSRNYDYAHDYVKRGRDLSTDYDVRYDTDDRTSYDNTGTDQRTASDMHLNFVSDYGFNNVVNERGTTAYKSYRLDSHTASDDHVFHSWRHTWVEPLDYMGKDIDLYRYNGDFDGESRTIHILSYNGKAIGGYHFGRGETSEQGVMLNREGFTSRGANDFRGTWNNVFDIRG